MTDLSIFRLYGEGELSKDGYPRAWHDFGADHPLARYDEATGKRVKFGIKHLVREQAGHRCVRCGHPYTGGKHGNGEWSPCDAECHHGGPVRWRSRLTGDWHERRPEDNDLNVQALEFMLAEIDVVEAAWRILTVHHLNLNKADCRWWNLAPLCQRDHLQIQGKVLMKRAYILEHSDWFKPYAAGWYAAKYLNEDLTRDVAEERLDELLDLERMTT